MDLSREFAYIRKVFFPNWDRTKSWRVRNGVRSIYSESGYCDKEIKTIYVNMAQIGGTTELRLVLIHEICHAIAGPYHGTTWRNRMRKAERSARRTGLEKLADLVRSEIYEYEVIEDFKRQTGWSLQKEVYSAVRAALIDRPDTTYEEVVRLVADAVGRTTDDIQRQCRRLRQEYEDSREFQKLLSKGASGK